MKPGVTGKLKCYSALVSSIVAANYSAEAQIIYTDVNPDVVILPNNNYLLDMNNDGIMDYKMGLYERHGTDRYSTYSGKNYLIYWKSYQAKAECLGKDSLEIKMDCSYNYKSHLSNIAPLDIG